MGVWGQGRTGRLGQELDRNGTGLQDEGLDDWKRAGWQELVWNRTADAGRRAGVQEFGLAGWTAENEDKLMG